MTKERTMSKARTAGERIAFSIDPEGTLGAALWRRRIARRIDAAIARNGHKMYDMGREDQCAARATPKAAPGKRGNRKGVK